MPLSEFLRMARGKLESAQQKSCHTDLSSRSENDLVELVWENGQIVMQGQSSRVTQSPTRNNLPSNASRVRDAGVGHATTSRFGKFGGVESILNDMAPVVPSRDLDLSQDDEMAPWLSYPMDDALGQDYVSELLPEISGVTANGMSTQNSFVSVDKRSNCEQTVDNLHSGGNALKASSSKDRLLSLWTPQHRQTSDGLVSGVSDIVSNNTSNHMDSSKKMEKQNIRPPTNNSNFLNFSHFSRPANLVKANLSNTDGIHASVSSGVERMEIKGKLAMVERVNSTPKDTDFHGPPATVSLVNSREPVANISKESCPPERTDNLCQETSMKNDKPLTMSNADNSTKGVPDGEKTVEPMVASSSVGSGNSADRVSCEHTHNSKRKFRDMEESECRSDDVDTESLDAKKRTPVRGSKRSRAAEVHNLSERRRRDRINEKMRALQELIPNCNKADKASMLDEAIEYLKTLQLQVQMMSMGAGLCMSPVMFPSRMQHMHPTLFPHFPPMGVGMGPGMGYGMGMLDINGGSSGCPIFHVPRMQVPYFPPPVSGITNFQRIPSPNLPLFGPNSVPRAPFVPFMGQPPVTSAIGLTALRNGTSGEVPSTSPVMNPRNPVATMNSQLMRNAEVGCSINDKSNQLQARKDVSDQPAAVPENKQGTDARGPTSLTSTTKTDTNKEPGCD